MATYRIAKYIAHTTNLSRRKAEEVIGRGEIAINGVPILSPALTVESEKDQVTWNGVALQLPEEEIYIKLHKPKGVVSSTKGTHGEEVVTDLLPKELRTRRWIIVGRLDKESTGLLLLTTDGATAETLMHPRYQKEKTYTVTVVGKVTEAKRAQLADGIEILLDTGPYKTHPAQVRVDSSTDEKSILTIQLREGKKRQIRLMCNAIHHPVLDLHRTSIGPLTLASLKEGQWEYLSGEEKTALLHFAQQGKKE